jgi:hypothetical protein
MSTPAASPPASGLRVTRAVAEQLGTYPEEARATIRRYMNSINENTVGKPVDIPGAPRGTRYLALEPEESALPVIIYRPNLPSEGSGWLIAALLDRDTYAQQREAESRGLLSNPTVRAGIRAAAITAAGVAVALAARRAIAPSQDEGESGKAAEPGDHLGDEDREVLGRLTRRPRRVGPLGPHARRGRGGHGSS